MTIECNGAHALVRLLRAEGVQHVFGIVGGKLGPLLNAIGREPSMRWWGVRHEASGPMMAAAVHAGTGQLAVALGEMGPGGINLVSGLGTAFNNHLPLLAIVTNQHRAASYPHAGMFMDLDMRALAAPLTKWCATVSDARRLPELVRTALREALSGRPGPVLLDIPQDVLGQACSFADGELDIAPARYRPLAAPRPDAQAVQDALALLEQARRPLLVAGGGVVAAGAAPLLRELAHKLNAPVVPTQMALGAVASDSPHFIGHGGLIAGEAVRHAFAQADVVLSVGCRWSSWMWDEHGALARRGHRVIAINIDPSALGRPVLHEVAMVADARQALADLLAGWTPQTAGRVEPGWLASVREVRAAYEGRLRAMAAEPSEVMHPAALAQALGQALPADALAVFDGGHTTFWSNDCTPVQDVRTRFHDPGMCQLGFGLPYALALQAAHPGRPVVNITGDGSFGFTLPELDSARRHRLPVVTVIHDNEAWGIIRQGQSMQQFELGTGLDGCDYAAIARGFGCHGERVERPDQVAPALVRALASGLPAVLDCRVRFVPHPAGPLFGSMNRYGFDALTQPA